MAPQNQHVIVVHTREIEVVYTGFELPWGSEPSAAHVVSWEFSVQHSVTAHLPLDFWLLSCLDSSLCSSECFKAGCVSKSTRLSCQVQNKRGHAFGKLIILEGHKYFLALLCQICVLLVLANIQTLSSFIILFKVIMSVSIRATSAYFPRKCFYYIYLCVCMCVCIHDTVCVWRSEGNFSTFLYFYHVGTRVKLRLPILASSVFTR